MMYLVMLIQTKGIIQHSDSGSHLWVLLKKGIQSFNSIYKHKTIKAPKDGVWLKGKTGETLNTFGLDMYNAM